MDKEIKINVSDAIGISESISISTESNYLLISNKEKVAYLLNNSDLNQNDIIDVFIGLHIILEVGINTLFRQLISPVLKEKIDIHEMVENLDKVNFIDKTIMFIYYSRFDFKDLDQAGRFHSIISKLRSFSEMRNKLLHGHSISTRSENGVNTKSRLAKNLNLNKLQEQLLNFRFILEGMGFYLDSLNMGVTDAGKKAYKESFLDYSFLPITHFGSE